MSKAVVPVEKKRLDVSSKAWASTGEKGRGEMRNPLYCYHVTWDGYVPSILREGLIPNRHPNWEGWKAAGEKSKRAVFLAGDLGRAEIWWDVMGNNASSVEYHPLEEDFAVLKIDCRGLKLVPHSPDDDGEYPGDWEYPGVITPDRIQVLDLKFFQHTRRD